VARHAQAAAGEQPQLPLRGEAWPGGSRPARAFA
jgi:hypothetical protein